MKKEKIIQMYNALVKIAKHYQTADQLLRNGGQYGLDAHEELAMSYENIQAEAKAGLKGIGLKTINKLK